MSARGLPPTPGPWVYHSGAVYAVSQVDTPGDATNRLLLADRNNPATAPCERDANAKLAALAPELRDALELALFHAHRQHVSLLAKCRADVCVRAREVLYRVPDSLVEREATAARAVLRDDVEDAAAVARDSARSAVAWAKKRGKLRTFRGGLVAVR